MSERYSRQNVIKGWKQKELERAYIALIGGNYSSALSSFISSGLTALGVGEILLTGERIGDAGIFGFDGKLEDYLKALNPEVRVSSHETKLSYLEITKSILNPIPNIIIDVSNSLESYSSSLSYGIDKDIPVFVGISNNNGFVFLRRLKEAEETKENLEQITNILSRFRESEEGKINSEILAPIILDETRKYIMPIQGDVKTENLCRKNIDYIRYIDKNVLMVGAGAIGTFAGIGLALNSIKNLYIADFDSIEINNLNRQILFYDSFNENKASVLCSRLRKISKKYNIQKSNFISLEEKIDESSVKFLEREEINIILGCVDNMYTRAVLNMLALDKKIPYIDAGSGKFGCDVKTYIPEKTACLDCQMSGVIKERAKQEVELTKKPRNGCIFEPSLLMPNEVAGALIVNRLKNIEETPKSLSFLSGDGVKIKETNQKCRDDCNPYSVIAELRKIK